MPQRNVHRAFIAVLYAETNVACADGARRTHYGRIVQTLRAGWVGSKDAPTASRNGSEIVRWDYKHLVLFALVSMIVGLSMTASQPESSLAKPASKPNIIFILTDDMRQDDLQYMKETTNLAGQGMSFNNAFVSTPLC